MKNRWIALGCGFAFLFVLALILIPSQGCVIRIGSSDDSWVSWGSNSKKSDTATKETPLDMQAGDSLILETSFGNIDIQVADSNPHIEGAITAYADTKKDAEMALQHMTLRTEKNQNEVRVILEKEKTDVVDMDEISLNAAYRVYLPTSVKVSAKTGSGSVTAVGSIGDSNLRSGYGSVRAEGTKGKLTVSSSSGNIEIVRIQGGNVEAKTSYGNITAKDIGGEEILLSSSSGKITANQIKGKSISIESTYGALAITQSDGDLNAKTASGSITLQNTGQGRFDLHSSYGNVQVENCSGTLKAKSSNGTIRIKDFQGEVDAESGYGAVQLDGTFRGLSAKSSSGSVEVKARADSRAESGWILSSGYGDVQLTVPASFSCELEARTGYGSIHSDFPITVPAGHDTGKNQLVGTIGAGGGKVSLKTSNGRIRLNKY